MIKFLLPIVQKFRRFYWRIVRPVTRGVRAIVVNQNEEILLVAHTYQEGWFLPGGKVSRNEKDENAYEYKKDTIVVFVVDSFTQVSKKHFEVERHSFFNPEMLPGKTSPGTRRRIEEWLGKQQTNNQW